MNWLIKLLGGGALKSVDSILGRFVKNKDAAEANIHSEQMSASESMAAEFQHRENRTWWDSLIDGINRLPRPLMVFEALALLHWAVIDPLGFAATMTALNTVPEWLALVIAQVILLYMGGRMLDKWNGKMKGPSRKQVEETMNAMRELRAMKEQESQPDAPPSVIAWNSERMK